MSSCEIVPASNENITCYFCDNALELPRWCLGKDCETCKNCHSDVCEMCHKIFCTEYGQKWRQYRCGSECFCSKKCYEANDEKLNKAADVV